MTAKTTALRTLYVHFVLNSVIFPQILYDIVRGPLQWAPDIVLYAQHFLPVKFFFPSITLINFVSSYPKMEPEPMNNARD